MISIEPNNKVSMTLKMNKEGSFYSITDRDTGNKLDYIIPNQATKEERIRQLANFIHKSIALRILD